jgi:hypothetical protein
MALMEPVCLIPISECGLQSSTYLRPIPASTSSVVGLHPRKVGRLSEQLVGTAPRVVPGGQVQHHDLSVSTCSIIVGRADDKPSGSPATKRGQSASSAGVSPPSVPIASSGVARLSQTMASGHVLVHVSDQTLRISSGLSADHVEGQHGVRLVRPCRYRPLEILT